MTAVSKVSKTVRATTTNIDLDISEASATIDLSGSLGYNYLVIQLENTGVLSATGTLALTGSITGLTAIALPAGLFPITGATAFANISAASYSAMVIVKSGMLETLTLTYTRTGAGSGSVKIRVLQTSAM